MSLPICPFCDSTSIEVITVTSTFKIPFCDDAAIKHDMHHCHNCLEVGDFDGTLDPILETKVKSAHKSSAAYLIDELKKSGITMVCFERVFQIPFGTHKRWIKGNISESELELLRLVLFLPALLHVADNNYTIPKEKE
jgi:hypothetical protein